MVSHLPGKCLDMHTSLGCDVFSFIVLLTLFYNFWDTVVELGLRPEIPMFR